MKTYFFSFVFLFVPQLLLAQTITLNSVQGNKKIKTIEEKSLIDLYKDNPEDNKLRKIQGRLLSVTDSSLLVKPFLKKKILTISKDQITHLRKVNIGTMFVGAMAFSAAAYIIMDSLNEDATTSFTFAGYIGMPVFFLT